MKGGMWLAPGEYARHLKTQKAVPVLLEALKEAREHLDWCGWGDSYERECARADGLPEKIDAAIAQAEAI